MKQVKIILQTKNPIANWWDRMIIMKMNDMRKKYVWDKCKMIDVSERKCFSSKIKNVALKLSIECDHDGNRDIAINKRPVSNTCP